MLLKQFCLRVVRKYSEFRTKAFSTKYLLFTNVLISSSSSSLGDLIEQKYEIYHGEIQHFDFIRTRQMAFSGSVAGVIIHNWYNILDKVIIGKSLYMVIKKLILDQCINSPIVILAFFASVAIFEDDPIQDFTEEVRDKFWVLYKAEWIVWPPAQIINFYFLPTRYRVTYDSMISLGYDIYTSNIKHKKSDKQQND